ncbi:MAG TPA: T9SS type A sorting domain-containing protein [Rubricoccaceae bacterium]|nr:T9SS type A sorting domain-containing protein [Rubricoccaceae bacterium]
MYLRICPLLLLALLRAGAPAAQAPDFVWARGGQAGGSNRAAWAPDGSTFAVGGDDGTVKVFDGEPRFLLRTIPVNSTNVWDVTYAPDGTRIATTGEDNDVAVWDVNTGDEVWRVDVGNWAYGIEFSPDGSLLTFAYDDDVEVRNASTGALLQTLAQGAEAIDASFSPDGQRLATSDRARNVRIYRTSDWTIERTLTGAPHFPELAFSPNGSVLAAAGGDLNAFIQLWDPNTGQPLRTLPIGSHISNARYTGFTSDGQYVFAGHEYDGVNIFNVETGALVSHVPDVMSIRLAPDGQTFIGQPVGCGDWGPRWVAFTFPEGQLIDPFMTHTSTVHGLDVSKGGDLVATGAFYFDSAVRIWDGATGAHQRELLYTCNSDGVTEVAFSPDDSLVAAGGGDWDAEVRIWRRSDGELLHELAFGRTTVVDGMQFSPDGQRIAIGSLDPELVIVNLSGMFVEHVVTTGQTADLAYSADGSRLAVGTWLAGIRIVDTGTGDIVRTISGAHGGAVRRVDFSADGTLLVSGGDDGLVKVWSVADGSLVRTMTGHSGAVTALDLSDDDRFVVSGGDTTIRLWDFGTGALRHTYTEEAWAPTDVEFFPNGASFAYTREDATLAVAHNPLVVSSEDGPGSESPSSFALSAVYPNPFNPQARFTLVVAEAQPVLVEVYDALGRRVATLHEGPLAAGTHTFTLDGSGLPSGAYFVRATGQGVTATRTAVLLK